MYSETFCDRDPKHGGVLLVPLKYTVDICTGMPKRTLEITHETPFYCLVNANNEAHFY